MGNERLKSFLLVSLIIISVLLTQQLWIRLPYNIIPSTDEKVVIEQNNNILSNVVTPDKYIIHLGSFHTILYSDEEYNLWDESIKVLRNAFATQESKLSFENHEKFTGDIFKKSIELYFPEEIPTYILLRVLDVKENNTIHKKIESVNRIYIPLSKGENFIIFSNGINNLIVRNVEIDKSELNEILLAIDKSEYTRYYSLYEAFNVESQSYITLNMKPLPEGYVKNEIEVTNKGQIEAIAQSFFDKDLDYIRKIEESDGSIIYLNSSDESLKISSDGIITYYNSIDRNEVERNLFISLNTALDFVSNHIGWPEDAYLSSIEEIESDNNKGYKFKFFYRVDGKPVILNNSKVEAPIVLEVFNEEIKSYKRYIRIKDKSKLVSINIEPGLTSSEVLDKNLSIIENKYVLDTQNNNNVSKDKLRHQILSSIEDIYLAYYDPCENKLGEELRSVWVIKIAGETYMFDTNTGSIVDRGNAY